MDEQPNVVLDDARLRSLVAVVERFDDLYGRVEWVAGALQRDGGPTFARHEREVAVTVTALLVAAKQAAPRIGCDWQPAASVLLIALSSPGVAHREDVNAPQVAAACLGGGWAPPGAPDLPTRFWEPAGLALQAMTYKSVHNGLHSLATKNVPPLTRYRCRCRGRFDELVVRGAHAITAWLASDADCGGRAWPTIRQWRCDERTLWEFVSNAVLGPGRPGGGSCGGRPLPGAYGTCLLGRYLQDAVGLRVGTVETYVCMECEKLCGQPTCTLHPAATVMVSSSRNHFVTPRWQLPEDDQAWGYEQVERRTCNNPSCVQRLRDALDGRLKTAKPIYPTTLAACPACHTAIAGQRPISVWTRHP